MKFKKTPIITLVLSFGIISALMFTKISATFAKEIILKVNEPNAFVDEKPIQIDSTNNSVKPFLDTNNRTLIPLRFISEQFEANVFWDQDTKAITVNYKDTIAILKLNDTSALLNGTPVQMDTAPIMKDEKVYVPLRFLAESVLDKKIEYNNGLIAIYDNGINVLKGKEHLFNTISTDLVKVDSKKQLAEIYSTFPKQDKTIMYDMGVPEMAINSAPSESKLADSSTPRYAGGGADYSKTNVQVEGVDEADIVKTDGKYIYYISNNTLHVVDATNPSKLLVKKQISYTINYQEYKNKPNVRPETFSPMEMYLDTDSNTLTLIGSYNKGFNNAVPYNDIGYYRNGDVKVIVFDLKDLTLNELRTFVIEGSYSNSRKIGDYVYLVSQNYIYDFKEEIQLPVVYDSITRKETEISFDKFYYIKPEIDMYSGTLLNISSINVKDTSKTIDVSTYLTNVENVYSSVDNLYLSSSLYNEKSTNTKISKFSLNKGDVSFVATQTIDGSILNQFSMDEHNGYFRVCTTNYTYTNTDTRMHNNLFIYDKNLNLVGKITELAKNEKIYSARFLGDRIYIVTFKQVDPLFVIDAKDPTKPYVQGELKIPGYSTYLHPYDENHIIGFGMNTEQVGSTDAVRNAGLKMALFDITDVNNPKEKFNQVIGDAGSYSELIYNHKVLLFSKEKNLLAFPVTIVKNESKTINNATFYGNYTFQGAVVYSLNLKNGFSEKVLISSSDDPFDYYLGPIQRLIYIKDTLYTLSANQIKSLDLNSYKELDTLTLKKN